MAVDSTLHPQGAPVDPPKRRRRRWLLIVLPVLALLVVWQILASVTDTVQGPVASAAAVVDEVYDAAYSDEIIRHADSLPKELNILLVGLDNRVASDDNHADAIHLLTIRTKDSVGVTITSIPRGTEVTGYGIPKEFSFLANVRALKGRKALMKAVARVAGKKKIHYFAEVTFSQVMGVLELIGYKDPATALQYLRHRKSYLHGDIQRSYNQGKFIRSQIIRRTNLLTGAKGDLLLRMGLGMIDTDLDLETVQAIVYLLRERGGTEPAMVSLEMRPKINLARLDSTDTPEPDQIAAAVNALVRRTGKDIDDLGRYDPYPALATLVERATLNGRSPRTVVAILAPVFEQKAWLQVQERPRRRSLRDSVERLLVRAYTELKKPEKANEVVAYMAAERESFAEVEREERRFTYGRRAGVPKSADRVAALRARRDNLGQRQTRIEPQPKLTPTRAIEVERPRHLEERVEAPPPPPAPPAENEEPQVRNLGDPQ